MEKNVVVKILLLNKIFVFNYQLLRDIIIRHSSFFYLMFWFLFFFAINFFKSSINQVYLLRGSNLLQAKKPRFEKIRKWKSLQIYSFRFVNNFRIFYFSTRFSIEKSRTWFYRKTFLCFIVLNTKANRPMTIGFNTNWRPNNCLGISWPCP